MPTITPIVTQSDPEILAALARLEQSIISVRSHARVMHNWGFDRDTRKIVPHLIQTIDIYGFQN
ncbi:MAG: hypothetical protein AAFY50_19380 [Cyanobacteria bacterium J06648_1]